jgi:hypothetical protein
MTKSLAKPGFFPSLETTARIDASDRASALQAAGNRYEALLRELEGQYLAKAAELRTGA